MKLRLKLYCVTHDIVLMHFVVEAIEEKLGRNRERIGSPDMASLRVEHNPEQGTTEALSQPFVVFVNDNPTPRYRLTRQQAYELLTSLQRALGIVKTG